MHSRVAAVKAPRTHNRRGVTGSGRRRREGRESEPQRLNISRHLFYSAVLVLLVVLVCCGSGGAHAVWSVSGDAQLLQYAEIFVLQETPVKPKDGSESKVRDSFVSPSLVRAGGVMAVIFEGTLVRCPTKQVYPAEIVAGYANLAWGLSFLVAEAIKDT
ncbi:trans-sialidase [Trypanosoma cruzi]|nr:trans-sialidase [Trypanosoma cruzi]